MRRFYVVLELSDDEWVGDNSAMATWIDGAMNKDAGQNDIDSTVYTNLADMVADNPLDALAGIADA